MTWRIIAVWTVVAVTVFVVLLSVPLVFAASGSGHEQGQAGESRHLSVQGDITPFGIVPGESVRTCVAGLPTRPVTNLLRWEVRFVLSSGEAVATEQIEVPHRGFSCVDLSYERALSADEAVARAALEPTGRLQLAVQVLPLFSMARGQLVENGEISNAGTIEIVNHTTGQTLVTGRFGLKSYDLAHP